MKRISFFVIACCFLFPLQNSAQDSSSVRLFTRDGQFKSHLFRVFLTKNITLLNKPVLKLYSTSSFFEKKDRIVQSFSPIEVAPDQQWIEEIDGSKITFNGTLMLFDIRQMSIPLQFAMRRVTVTLDWTDSSEPDKNLVIQGDEIYVADSLHTSFYTLLFLLAILLIFGKILGNKGKNLLLVCCNEYGRLSLSRTQVALWTISTGAMVFAFGLIRLEIPSIPESLIALMGLSLATGSIRYFISSDTENNKPQITDVKPLSLKNLFLEYNKSTNNSTPSLPKVQMLFWTIIALVLFVTKSMTDGELWQVPWELVALMGISQTAYMAKPINDKLKEKQPGEPVPPKVT